MSSATKGSRYSAGRLEVAAEDGLGVVDEHREVGAALVADEERSVVGDELGEQRHDEQREEDPQRDVAAAVRAKGAPAPLGDRRQPPLPGGLRPSLEVALLLGTGGRVRQEIGAVAAHRPVLDERVHRLGWRPFGTPVREAARGAIVQAVDQPLLATEPLACPPLAAPRRGAGIIFATALPGAMPVDVTPFATGLGAGPSRCGLLDTGPVALETASTGLVRFVPVAPFPTPALFSASRPRAAGALPGERSRERPPLEVDARVDDGVHDVADDVEHQPEHGEEEQRAEHDRVVAG